MTFSRRSVVDVSLLGLVNAMWAAQYPAYKVASEKWVQSPSAVGLFLLRQSFCFHSCFGYFPRLGFREQSNGLGPANSLATGRG